VCCVVDMKRRKVSSSASSSMRASVKRVIMNAMASGERGGMPPTTDYVAEVLLRTDASKRRLNQKMLRKKIASDVEHLRTHDTDVRELFRKMCIPAAPEDVAGEGEASEASSVPVKLNASLYGQSDRKADENTRTLKKKKKIKKRRVHSSKDGADAIRSNDPKYGNSPPDADDSAPVSFKVPRPHQRLNDMAGIENILEQVRELVQYPLLHPEIYDSLGIKPTKGVLLHGPPGCGKTLLARAIGGELGHTVTFFSLSAPELVSWRSGDTERNIRSLFKEAEMEESGALIFIDEIDAIAGKRGARGMDRRIVSQLLTAMDRCGAADSSQGEREESSKTMPTKTDLEATSERSEGAEKTSSEASKKRQRSEARRRGNVVVIGATSRPEELDPSLRRAGRFDRELCVGVPDVAGRRSILEKLTQTLPRAKIDCGTLAKRTPGYVGADLVALVREAGIVAVNRTFGKLYGADKRSNSDANTNCDDKSDAMDVASAVAASPTTNGGNDETHAIRRLSPEELARLHVEMRDFQDALKRVQPTAKREGFATIPGVTWADVGSLAEVRKELILSILKPIQEPELFSRLGLDVPAGVLLYGPPGCGKTLLAKAVAAEAQANFIAIKGPELLDKYVGESEKAVRALFLRAQTSAPCIIFFDELDSLAPRRGGGGSGGNGVSERVVNQLLTALDGFAARRGVFVIGATNRPDILDPALLRPGRLDRLIHVPLPPNDAARFDILRTLTRKTPIDVQDEKARDSILMHVAKRCENFSGADLQAVVREASLAALQDTFDDDASSSPASSSMYVKASHFERALTKVRPSVGKMDRAVYAKMHRDRCDR